MAYNFLPSGRDQAFLLPPDLRDWLPTDHLAWFVLDMVDQLDLGPFLRAYRADGHGRAAYDPKTLLGVLLYAYATGVRSSRQIQRRCVEDLAFRVLAAGQARPAGQVPQGRQAVGVQERPAPRGDDRQAQQRGRQGPLRQTQGDCRGGLRAEQGCPWCSPADAPRDGRVRRGVEAVVRHP
jgi:hypothetical protein